MGKPSIRTREAKLTFVGALPVQELEGGLREPPTEFRIFSNGLNTGIKGGERIEVVFDEQAAETVMATFVEQGRPYLTFDYEHQAAADVPMEAPSAGSFVPMVRNGELWATNIKWTPRADVYIRNREYEFFSPWFLHDAPEDGPMRVVQLMNVGLTNVPALNNIEPLAASAKDDQMDEKDKKIEELSATVKALSDKVEEQTKALSDKDEEMKALAAKLSAEGDEPEEEEEVKANAQLRAKVIALTGQDSIAGAVGVLEGMKASAAEGAQLKAEAKKALAAKLSADFDKQFDDAKEAGVSVAECDEIKATALKDFGADGKVTDGAVKYAAAVLGAKRGNPSVPTARNTPPVNTGEFGDMKLSTGIDPGKRAELAAGKIKMEYAG